MNDFLNGVRLECPLCRQPTQTYSYSPTPITSVVELGPMLPRSPSPTASRFIGTFRTYFNRMGAAPLFWCIAPAGAPTWELCVRAVLFHGVSVQTVKDISKQTADDDDGRPSAWVEAYGELQLGDDGIAVIKAVK